MLPKQITTWTLLLLFRPVLAIYEIPHDLPDGLYTVQFPITTPSDDNITTTTTTSFDFKKPLVRRVPKRKTPQYNQLPKLAETPNDYDMLESIRPPLRYNLTDPYAQFGEENKINAFPLTVTRHDCKYAVRPLWPNDWNEARHNLYVYCDKFLVPQRTSHIAISKHGKAAAYVCNISRSPRVCTREEYQWAEFHWLDLRCGDLQPGWVEMGHQGKVYGRTHVGFPICSDFRDLNEVTWSVDELMEYAEDEY